MLEPPHEIEMMYKVLIGTWTVIVLILFTCLIMFTGCTLTFQNVTSLGDTSDLSDETNHPTATIPLFTYRF